MKVEVYTMIDELSYREVPEQVQEVDDLRQAAEFIAKLEDGRFHWSYIIGELGDLGEFHGGGRSYLLSDYA